MEHIELEVLIQAPAQKVWDGITNWQAQSQWMLGTKVWPVDGDGTGVGGKIEAFTGIWRIGFLDTMEITAWDPPRLCRILPNCYIGLLVTKSPPISPPILWRQQFAIANLAI